MIPARATTAHHHKAPHRLSDVLRRIAAYDMGEHVTLGFLMRRLRGRGYGALLFLFAAPNIIPLPPGSSTILATPLLILSAQLMLGLRAPHLPAFLAHAKMKRETFQTIVGKLLPWIERAEKYLKPRAKFLTGMLARRIIGLLIFILSAILVLPIPLGNLLPGLAVAILALALVERDGLAVIVGVVAFVASVIFVGGLVAGFLLAIRKALSSWFGL